VSGEQQAGRKPANPRIIFHSHLSFAICHSFTLSRVLLVQGQGLLLVSSFGAIHRKVLQPGERYVVDTGHLVAWEGTTQYTLRKAAAGFFRSMVSGEGIVAEFTGPGEILIQTRNLAALAGLLKPFFPSQSGGGGGSGFNINLGG